MEEVENLDRAALEGWSAIYERVLTSDEIREIEQNIQKLAEVLKEIT